jgi:putative tricarboxylic transport membrane protein
MKKKDRLGGLFWLVLGVALCIESAALGLGQFRQPGAGFLPFLSGVLMALLGLSLTLSNLSKGSEQDQEVKGNKIWEIEYWKGFGVPLLCLAALLSYILLLNVLGFILTTFLWLFFLFKIGDPKRWLIPLILAVSTVVISYLMFGVWLQLQLPRGMFRL